MGDATPATTSDRRFGDGGSWRVEIPSVEGPAAMEAVVQAADDAGLVVHRVSQGSGIMLLSDDDIRAMASMGASRGIEVCLFVGPRAPWEGTAQVASADGRLVGWRHTGMDQLSYALDDVLRAVDLGIRSVLVADEGLIWLLGEARRRGELPSSLVIKASALLGLANPVGISMLVEDGLDSANVSSEISIPRLGALRSVIDIPVDVYIEGPDGLGGYLRYHELPELVRVGAPIYLKFGLRNAPAIYPAGAHLESAVLGTARERVRRAALGVTRVDQASMSPLVRERPGVPVG